MAYGLFDKTQIHKKQTGACPYDDNQGQQVGRP
jgi:hypothetical protein